MADETARAALLAHLWVLMGGGWDGDAEAACERCHREVQIRWGQPMPELTDACPSTARVDPWRWYCRLCGATGENADRTITRAEAHSHVGADGPHARPTVADSESGRLLHVWCY